MQFRNFINFVLSASIIGFVLALIPVAFQVFAAFSVFILGVNFAQWLMTVTRKHFMYKKVSPRDKAVLITGCDSGFGNMLAKRLDKLGFRVFAACLDPTGEGAQTLARSCSSNLTTVHMDVTSEKSIGAAKEFLEERLANGILWAVVNNAGIGQVGEIDWTPFEEIQKVYDVNCHGMLRVTKAFLPLIKKSKGRIVNMNSDVGRYTSVGFTGYCMSKSAAVALTTGLRMELAKWGVKAISIEPSFYKTPLTTTDHVRNITERAWNKAPQGIKEEYGEDYIYNLKRLTEKNLNIRCSLNVEEVVDCMEDAVLAEEPLTIYSPCRLVDKFIINVTLLLPNFILDNLQRIVLESYAMPVALRRKIK